MLNSTCRTIFVRLTIGSYVSVRSSRNEVRGKFGEQERCVRVARGVTESNSSFLSALQTSQVLSKLLKCSPNFPSALQTSQVLSKLPKCFISRWTHRWRMNQLFYNIFNPMENFFFSRDLFATSWACTIGIWSTLAQLNLITQIYKLCFKNYCRIWTNCSQEDVKTAEWQ